MVNLTLNKEKKLIKWIGTGEEYPPVEKLIQSIYKPRKENSSQRNKAHIVGSTDRESLRELEGGSGAT